MLQRTISAAAIVRDDRSEKKRPERPLHENNFRQNYFGVVEPVLVFPLLFLLLVLILVLLLVLSAVGTTRGGRGCGFNVTLAPGVVVFGPASCAPGGKGCGFSSTLEAGLGAPVLLTFLRYVLVLVTFLPLLAVLILVSVLPPVAWANDRLAPSNMAKTNVASFFIHSP